LTRTPPPAWKPGPFSTPLPTRSAGRRLVRGGELALTQAVAADPLVGSLIRSSSLEGELIEGGQAGELVQRFRLQASRPPQD
jgi:hypothetical protein